MVNYVNKIPVPTAPLTRYLQRNVWRGDQIVNNKQEDKLKYVMTDR